MFTITVKDTTYRTTAEEQTCTTQQEANQWAKQFRAEYPRDCGYKVTVTQEA